MKYSFYIYFILAFTILACDNPDLPIIPETPGTPSGTALVITGASARINQQLALIERLDEQNRLDDLAFISGVSSGGINAIILNGILDNNNPFGYQEYKDIILNLSNSDVLDNSRNNLPVDTRPLWNTFEQRLLQDVDLETFNDLTIPTALTSTNLDLLEIEVSSNITELDEIGGELVESLMATTSFPVAFPSIKINENIYVDGGLVENIPINATLKYQQLRGNPFEAIYIVTYQKNMETRWEEEVDFLGITGARENILELTLQNVGFDTDELSQNSFLDELVRIRTNYPELASRCFVYSPNIVDLPYYGVFDFSAATANDSYNRVSAWAASNEPVTLETYLTQNGR